MMRFDVKKISFGSVFIVYCMGLLSLTGGKTAFADAPAGLLKKIDEQQLWLMPHWRKILFYQNRLIKKDSGLIRDSRFYLAPTGRTDLKAELIANVNRFFDSEDLAKPDEHAQCRFPARLAFLDNQLKLFSEYGLKRVNCKALDDWRKGIDVVGASLVFSSYYPQSAASMFGHTLIKLHLRENSTSQLELLDVGLSYAASIDTQNTLLYMIKGLSGGFKGELSLTPYYVKLQEYNNSESRDLWEYPLNLSGDELTAIVNSAWEFGKHFQEYYYFDENCSWLPMLLIEAAKPEVELTPKFRTWVIPSDTVREIANYPGLVGESHFQASNWRQFLARYELLNSAEQVILKKIIRKPGSVSADELKLIDSELATVSVDGQTRVIDAWVEFLDFSQKLAGTGHPEQFEGVRKELLIRRSKLKVHSQALQIEKPKYSDPKDTHGPITFGLGYGAENTLGSFASFIIRPANNEIIQAGKASPSELEVRFLEFEGRYFSQSKDWVLENFHFIKVLTLSHFHPITKALSWGFDIGRDHPQFCDRNECTRWSFVGEGGVTFRCENVVLSPLLKMQAGYISSNSSPHRGVYASLGLHPMYFYRLSDSWKVGLGGYLDYAYTASVVAFQPEAVFQVSHWAGEWLGPNWEWRAQAQTNGSAHTAELGLRRNF